jgi:hypothetical protein
MLALLGTKQFESELILEGSWGQKGLGPAKCEMRFYNQSGHYMIEWESQFEYGEDVTHIGLQFKDRDLVDYDGIMGWLPTQAADLIESIGFKVDRKEFCG